MNPRDFGEYMAKLREAAGYESQATLARVSGVWNSTIARIEAGQTRQPDPNTLRKLAPYLNVSIDEIMMAAGYLSDASTGDSSPINLPPDTTNAHAAGLANYISSFMKERNLSAKELSLATDLSESLVDNILSGELSKPSPDTLKKLAEALGASYYTMVKLAGIIIKNSSDLAENDKEGTSAIWCRAEGLTEDDLAEVLALIASKERRRKKGETNR